VPRCARGELLGERLPVSSSEVPDLHGRMRVSREEGTVAPLLRSSLLFWHGRVAALDDTRVEYERLDDFVSAGGDRL
jgi:hypothetical protein